MVGGWTLSMHQAPTRVIIEGGGLQARANLNGGKLDKEPSAEIGEVYQPVVRDIQEQPHVHQSRHIHLQ